MLKVQLREMHAALIIIIIIIIIIVVIVMPLVGCRDSVAGIATPPPPSSFTIGTVASFGGKTAGIWR
jgi:hypothetical protein